MVIRHQQVNGDIEVFLIFLDLSEALRKQKSVIRNYELTSIDRFGYNYFLMSLSLFENRGLFHENLFDRTVFITYYIDTTLHFCQFPAV